MGESFLSSRGALHMPLRVALLHALLFTATALPAARLPFRTSSSPAPSLPSPQAGVGALTLRGGAVHTKRGEDNSTARDCAIHTGLIVAMGFAGYYACEAVINAIDQSRQPSGGMISWHYRRGKHAIANGRHVGEKAPAKRPLLRLQYHHGLPQSMKISWAGKTRFVGRIGVDMLVIVTYWATVLYLLRPRGLIRAVLHEIQQALCAELAKFDTTPALYNVHDYCHRAKLQSYNVPASSSTYWCRPVFEMDLEVSAAATFFFFNALMHSPGIVPREALWATHGLVGFGVAVMIYRYALNMGPFRTAFPLFPAPLTELLQAMKTMNSRDPCP